MTRPAASRRSQPETEAPPEPSRPELLALALVAASVIALEIVLTRIFSFITWHHYTPLIIGIALLGFGFAGSYLSARGGAAGDRATFLAHLTRETLAYAVSLPLALLLVSQVRFDPSRIFADWTPALWLAVYLAAVVVPFGAAGLVICRLIDRYRARAGRVYGTDLAASAAGVLAGLGLLGAAGAEAAALAAAFLAAVAATLLASAGGGHRRLARATTAVLGALAVAAAIAPPGLFRPPPSKEMAAFESEPALRQVRFEVSRWHPLARIDVTADMRGPAPDFGGELAPPLRASGAGAGEHFRYLFQDGTAPSAFLALAPPFESVPILRGYLQSAPYKIRPRARALVIGLGGGIDLAIALAHGSTAVTGVEVNPVTFGLLGRTFLDYGGGLAADPRVELVNAEGRAFARRSRASYDVIQLSGADTFAALVSGSGSLTEGYLYTVEAVEDFLDRLAPDGILSYSRPYFTPPRETLKLVATAARVLRARGVTDPSAHIMVIAGRKWAETLVSPAPFRPAEVEAIEAFARDSGFNLLATPSSSLRTPWDRYLELDESAASDFRRGYFFNVEPATDDRPFFFNYARWRTILSNRRLPINIGIQGYYTVDSPLGPLPVGNVLLLVAMVTILGLAVVLIIVPLRSRASALAAEPALAARVLAYFAALGLAFIAVEITLIQHFQLFLGGPTVALAIVLFALLGAAGFGSLAAERLEPRRLATIVPALVAVLVAELALVPAATHALAGAPGAVRVAVAIALTAVPGVLMGMPFPLGIRLVAARGRSRALVPWAWAANGLFSVLGSVASVFAAMLAGFGAVLGGAAAIYLAGFLALAPELGREGTPARDDPRTAKARR